MSTLRSKSSRLPPPKQCRMTRSLSRTGFHQSYKSNQKITTPPLLTRTHQQRMEKKYFLSKLQMKISWRFRTTKLPSNRPHLTMTGLKRETSPSTASTISFSALSWRPSIPTTTWRPRLSSLPTRDRILHRTWSINCKARSIVWMRVIQQFKKNPKRERRRGTRS